MHIWTSSSHQKGIRHTALVAATSEPLMRKSIEACAEKAISRLDENIQDDSLYLLCEWDAAKAELNICITDASKTRDAPESYHCVFSGVGQTLSDQQTYTESVKFWLHDYLSSYAPFFQYSLVAIFHSSTREHTELL